MHACTEINIAHILQIFWNRSTLEPYSFLLFSKKHIYIRKMMSSATITWLSSCMRLRAARTSVSSNGDGQLLLMPSIRAIMPTDWAWEERNTSSNAVLNSFNLKQKHTSVRHTASETISHPASDALSELNQKQYFKRMWWPFKNAKCRDTENLSRQTLNAYLASDNSVWPFWSGVSIGSSSCLAGAGDWTGYKTND